MALWTKVITTYYAAEYVYEQLNHFLTTASQLDAGSAWRHATPCGSLDIMEMTQLYTPCVNTLGRAYLALHVQPSQPDQQNSQMGPAVFEVIRRRRICPDNADCVLPCTCSNGLKSRPGKQM